MRNIKEGDHVRLKNDPKSTGTVDELYQEHGRDLASVVWDESGCIGYGPLEDLELVE